MSGALGFSSTRARTGRTRGAAPRPGPDGAADRAADPGPVDDIEVRFDDAEPAPATRTRARVRAPAHPTLRGVVPAKIGYLPGLDGLRALAVVSVLLYHGDVAALKGGFLGVEVFFVISGYLITSLLLAERKNTMRLDLRRFYARRAKRLLPALFLTLFLVLLVSVLFLHDEVATLRGDVVSSLLYVTNWFFIVGQKSYFEAVGRPSLVQHLWSLAVEEQFYLLWPLIFAAGMRFLGRKRLFIAVLVGAVASTVLMAVLYTPGVDPSRVYYGTDTRAGGLLIGAALAFVWAPYRLHKTVGRGAPLVLNAVGTLALGVLIVMLLVTDQYADSLYYGGFARVSIITAVVIAVVVHPAAALGPLLGIRPIRWVGLRSYGIYLYHWPIFQLTRPQLDVPFDGLPLLALRLGLTFAVAAVSYTYFEMPIRDGSLWRRLTALRTAPGSAGRQKRVRVALGSVAALVGLVLMVNLVVRAEPAATPDYLLAGATPAGLPPAAAALPPPRAATPPGSAARTTAPSTPAGTAVADPGAATDPAAPGTTVAADASTTVPTAPPDGVTPATPDPAAPPTAAPGPLKRITAIGDSVMLGAAPTLQSGLNGDVFVDARVGRQVSEGLQILHLWQEKGLLGEVVVVHIGNNGTFSEAQFQEMRDILKDVPKVVFVNNKVPRGWEEGNNQVIAAGMASMPNAALLDWKNESGAHPEWFWTDGMHLRPDGAAAYTNFINSLL